MRRSLLRLLVLAVLALPAQAADWWLLGTDPQNASSMNGASKDANVPAGWAAALQIEGWTYDITAGLAISDVFALDAATAQSVTNAFASAGKPVPEGAFREIAEPAFVDLDDPFHPDFARPRSRRGPNDLGHLGWRGANGEYPRHLGALPPLYPEATLLILR